MGGTLLSGGIAGVLLAWWFREQGPPLKKYQYEIEEELEEKSGKDRVSLQRKLVFTISFTNSKI